MYLTRKIEFSASHYYHNPALSPEENRRIFGKCNNPNGHGHNYRLEVTVAGEIDSSTGMVCNLSELDSFVEQNILDRFDHAHLNRDQELFTDTVPTSENVCRAIFGIVKGGFKLANLQKVWLGETSLNSFEYLEEADR